MKTFTYAKGTVDGKKRKIAIAFDEPMFRKINYIAAKNGNCFAAQVRILVGLGVEALTADNAKRGSDDINLE